MEVGRWACLVAACILAAVATCSAQEGRVHGQEGRGQEMEAPEYEIVIARYKENATTLAWLAEVPSFYQITIVNKVIASYPFPPPCPLYPHGSEEFACLLEGRMLTTMCSTWALGVQVPRDLIGHCITNRNALGKHSSERQFRHDWQPWY